MKTSATIFALFLSTLASSTTAFAPLKASKITTTLNNIPTGKNAGYTSKTAEWDITNIGPNVSIQGQTRNTWSFEDASKEMVQVALQSTGRPINSDIQLWIGPNWTPVTVKVHSEDGKDYPVQTLVGTRNKVANLEIMNTGPYTMPVKAVASYAIDPLASARDQITFVSEGRYMEGGSVYHHSFSSDIDQYQVLLKTEGKQLNAKIELLNGPNNIKMEYEVFTNNGELNSLFVVFECPGEGNAIRVKNLAPMTYPLVVYESASKVREADAKGMTWR